jgi:hypothetical protein
MASTNIILIVRISPAYNRIRVIIACPQAKEKGPASGPFSL